MGSVTTGFPVAESRSRKRVRRARIVQGGTSRPVRALTGSPLEAQLLAQIHWSGLPEPELQARLVPGRRFAADFCWCCPRLVVEVQGGLFRSRRTGRRGIGHTSTGGILADIEKQAELVALGWRVLPVGAPHIRDGRALRWIQRALEAGQNQE